MPHSLRLLAVLPILFAGCATTAESRPSPARTAPEPTDEVWVWEAASETVVRSVRVDEEGRPLQTVDGAVMFAGGRRYRLRIDERQVRALDCDVMNETGEVAYSDEAVTTRGLSLCLADADADDDAGCRTLMEPSNDGDAAEVNESIVPVGAIGPYVFVVASRWSYECGAHGNADYSALVVDVRDGSATSPAELFRAGPALRVRALTKLQDEFEDRFDPEVAAEGISLVSLRPIFDATGLRLAVRFAAEACYACSGDDWSSYTVSTEVETRELGEPLGLFVIPPGATAYAHAHDGSELLGASFGPG